MLAWIVKRCYKIHLRVGHISLPYFRLRDVNITKNGFTLVSYTSKSHFMQILKYDITMFNFSKLKKYAYAAVSLAAM